MTKRFRLGKLAIVAVLTILIWVWADRAKTEEFSITNAFIRVDTSADPRLWISITNKATTTVSKIVLEGSSSSIDKAQRDIREKNIAFEFFLNPQQFPELLEAGQHSIGLAEFFRKNPLIRQLGLSVKSCVPPRVDIQVQKLVERELNVDCFDEKGEALRTETIEPAKAAIPVPNDWTANARIELTGAEINQAKSVFVTKQPFIKLSDGQIKVSADSVKVRLSPAERVLPEYTLKRPTIGFVLSPNLIGKYNVELLNPQEVSVINIRATTEARSAFEQQTYQILLYISDNDTQNPSEEKKRKVDYNFPKQFVENGEIQLKGEPVEARFKLVPITSNPPT